MGGQTGSGRLYDQAGTQAPRTYLDALDATVADGANALQIWVEASFGQVVGMADMVPGHGLFPAYFTDFRHNIKTS